MAEEKYIFGPVPSRRLGLSLGLDIVPSKVCTLDCIYCEVGLTTKKTIERREYVPVAAVLGELKARLEKGLRADFITITGSGETTLNSRLGFLIDEIKKLPAFRLPSLPTAHCFICRTSDGIVPKPMWCFLRSMPLMSRLLP